MTIWLLGLLLMASGAGLGYRQGAVRVAFSFVAILLGGLLAGPLGRLVRPLLVSCGLKTPGLAWLLAPIVAFLVISIVFKIAALMAHQKADVYFRYHAGELRQALWERLNSRVGLCLGIFNGAAYLVLLSFLIYNGSYWTCQIASSESDPRMMRLLNTLGRDLQSSGFAKVGRAVYSMPELWYDTADLAGLIYSNPMSEAALSRYPAFLALTERPEFRDLGADAAFGELRLKHAPFMDIINYGRIDAMLQDPDFVMMLWGIILPDMQDLRTFLETGRSPKYDSEGILGRWKIDPTAVVTAFRRAKPNVTAKEMIVKRRNLLAAFDKVSFMAMTEGRAILRNSPPLRLEQVPGVKLETCDCRWNNVGGKYQLTLTLGGQSLDVTASVDGDRLTMINEGAPFAFNRED